MRSILAVSVAWMLVTLSCQRTPTLPPLTAADSARVVADNVSHRAEVDAFFRTDPASPFLRDSSVSYHGINWYPINPRFRGESVLHRYERPETVVVLGTKGEERRQLRYGYLELVVPGDPDDAVIRLQVYKFTPYDAQRFLLYPHHLSVWFTDRTTGVETYPVGRYLEVGDEQADPDARYIIDLNKAYNPYCAYSALYSCAVPREEDRLDVAVRVGEMKYHE
jgi:uncharacterized protein (DUF1684 family)